MHACSCVIGRVRRHALVHGNVTRGLALVFAILNGTASVTACATVDRTSIPGTVPVGEWTGDLHAPELPAAIGFLARVRGNTLALDIVALEAMGFSGGPVSGMRVSGDSLYFTWTSEGDRACTLVRGSDSSYAGDCTREGDSPWRVRLTPPAKRRDPMGYARSILARNDRVWRSRNADWGRLHIADDAPDTIDAKARSAEVQQAIRHGTALLGAAMYDRPLDAFLLKDREEILALSGQRAASTADPHGSTVLLARYGSMPGVMRHEIMHVLSINLWGAPPEPAAWVREGIATYASGGCRGYGFHQLSANMLQRGELVSIRQLLDEFYQHSDLVTYLQSASVFQFLFEARGRDYARAVWQSGLETVLARDRQSLDAFEREWRATIVAPEHHPERVDWSRIKNGNGCG